jgi:hypothetical protein
MAKRISRRAAQRRTAEINAAQNNPAALESALQERLDGYKPAGVGALTWEAVGPTHREVMQRAGITGSDSFIKHLGVVGKYLVYRHSNGESIGIRDAFTSLAIDHYYLHGLDGDSERTRNDYRSRLINVARSVNPGATAPIATPTFGHRNVRPGYAPQEMAAIRRTALRQSSTLRRRQLCAIVGLCAGAGLDSTDLRDLRRRNIIDHNGDGIEISVPGCRARTVWVRRSLEDLLRIGIDGLKPGELIIGQNEDRRNITTGILSRCDLYDAPDLDASRLRSTWLTWLLTRPVPIQVILDAAGLKTARSLTDLIGELPPCSDEQLSLTREEES